MIYNLQARHHGLFAETFHRTLNNRFKIMNEASKLDSNDA